MVSVADAGAPGDAAASGKVGGNVGEAAHEGFQQSQRQQGGRPLRAEGPRRLGAGQTPILKLERFKVQARKRAESH